MVTVFIVVLLDKSIQLDSTVSWVKANAGQTGFYRVNYDMSDWMQFITMLHNRHIVRAVFIVCSIILLLLVLCPSCVCIDCVCACVALHYSMHNHTRAHMHAHIDAYTYVYMYMYTQSHLPTNMHMFTHLSFINILSQHFSFCRLLIELG